MDTLFFLKVVSLLQSLKSLSLTSYLVDLPIGLEINIHLGSSLRSWRFVTVGRSNLVTSDICLGVIGASDEITASNILLRCPG